jgi:putative hydrolase of the HAD superfamily
MCFTVAVRSHSPPLDSAVTSHLIFDFFGTLVAYSPSRTSQGYCASHRFYTANGGQLDYPTFLECWVAGSAELDASTSENHNEYSMVDAAQSFQRHASFASDAGVLEELAALYLREWNKGVRYIDGVSLMLRRLSDRFDLSIITNTHDLDLVPNHLQLMGIDRLFSRVITSVGFGRRKPSPSIFDFALSELSVSPSQCIYVGDSHVPDFEGPRAVGIRPLLIDPDCTAPVNPDERIHSILGLEAVLAAV